MKHKPLPDISITDLWESYGATVVGPDRSEWRKATCPMHEDRTPSASINEDAGKWTCFTCDEHGDVFDLILRMEPNVSGFADAVRFAESFAARSGGAVREPRRGSSLLPRGTGTRPGRGNWTPPWIRG